MINTLFQNQSCADPEVGHGNTEENLLYFIKRKHNLF